MVVNRSPIRKPKLTAAHRAARLRFAQEHIEDDENTARARVYCDEKLFVMGAGNRKVWIGADDEVPRKQTVKYPTKIMVFGAIAWWGKTQLVRMPAGLKITAAEYLDTLQNFTIPQVKILFGGDPDDSDNDSKGGGNRFEWVQDNASVHNAKVVKDWLSEQQWKTLSPWPAMSPDLNPIENVWGIMSQRLAGRSFDDGEDFWKAICDAWDAIDYNTIRSLYDSLPKRYAAVIEEEGGPTKY